MTVTCDHSKDVGLFRSISSFESRQSLYFLAFTMHFLYGRFDKREHMLEMCNMFIKCMHGNHLSKIYSKLDFHKLSLCFSFTSCLYYKLHILLV